MRLLNLKKGNRMGSSKIGAYYLWNHHISDEVVDAIHWHNDPTQAKESPC